MQGQLSENHTDPHFIIVTVSHIASNMEITLLCTELGQLWGWIQHLGNKTQQLSAGEDWGKENLISEF